MQRENISNAYFRYMKRIFILTCIISCVGILLYFRYETEKYPVVYLDQEELFGENNSNLKDFKIENGELISLSGDPWIEYTLKNRMLVKVIELEYTGVETKDDVGNIFNTETWENQEYKLKNGKTLIYYDAPAELQNLRFDLVSRQSVSFKINKIVLNTRYGLLYYCLKYIGLLVLYILGLLAYDYVFVRYRGNKKDCERYIPEIIGILLMGILVYVIKMQKISSMELNWMYIALFAYLLLVILAICKIKTRVFTEILLFTVLQISIVEMLSGMSYNFVHLPAGLANMGMVLLIMGIAYLFFRRIKYTFLITNIFIFILAVINHYYYQFRSNPFLATDLLLAKTVKTVIENYNFAIDEMMIFCILLEISILTYIHYAHKTEIKAKKKNIIIVTLLDLCMVLGIVVYNPTVSSWNMSAVVQNMGYINAFVNYAKHDLKKNRPSQYSTKEVEGVLGEYRANQENDEQELEDKPNLIVIMNESFSDLPAVYGFETNEDGMPNIHSLKQNTIKGNMMVSVFGGGTANTEFEFLTGNSMAFLNQGAPYVQYIKSEHESLASYLKELGYDTIAFHPYGGKNYNRNLVYDYFGFDQFISIEDDLTYNENLRSYMSDKADFENVIDIYERQKQESSNPIFLFNVTMQNHGSYNREKSDVDVTIVPKDKDLQFAQLQEYLSLIKQTDTAFEELKNYFETVDEKTVILMFGDHQPGLDSEIYETLEPGLSDESPATEILEKKYVVPFIMWANYDIDEEEQSLISPGYLRAFLLDFVGLPKSSYDNFLLDSRKECMAINSLGYYDSDGKLCSLQKNYDNILQMYHVLEYGNMFDKKVMQNWYTE